MKPDNRQQLMARPSKYWDEIRMVSAYRDTHTRGFPIIDRFTRVY